MKFTPRDLKIIRLALEYYAEYGGGIDYPDGDQAEEEMCEIEDLIQMIDVGTEARQS